LTVEIVSDTHTPKIINYNNKWYNNVNNVVYGVIHLTVGYTIMLIFYVYNNNTIWASGYRSAEFAVH